MTRQLSVLLVLMAGCGGRPTCVPVSGTVVVNGKDAVGGAVVTFHPVRPNAAVRELPRAETNADGSFTLTTFVANDGAPAGEYVVTVVWQPPVASALKLPGGERQARGPDRLKGKYATPEKSPLRVTVPAAAVRLEVSE